MSDIEIPHIAFPLRQAPAADGGGLVEVEQDTIDDVRQCVHVLLRTPLGVRPLAPQVGVEDPTFTRVDGDVLAATLEDQEDRAAVTVTASPVDATGEQQIEVLVALADEPDPQEETA